MTLQATQKFFSHLCFDQDFDVSKNLDSHWQTLSSNQKTIYRKLIFANVADILNFVFEKSFSLIEKDLEQKWIYQFLEKRLLKTRQYYKIPVLFFEFMTKENLWQQSEIDFLKELADYEFQKWWLYQKPHEDFKKENAKDLSLVESFVILNPNLVLKKYEYAIDQFFENQNEKDLIKKESHLVFYRDPNSLNVEIFRLDHLSYGFLETLQNQKKPLGNLIENFLEISNTQKQKFSLEEILAFIQNLTHKNIILSFQSENDIFND